MGIVIFGIQLKQLGKVDFRLLNLFRFPVDLTCQQMGLTIVSGNS